MTLAFALRGSNGLVLGVDSRVSFISETEVESRTEDTSTKFLQVNREIGILTYGLTEVGHESMRAIVDIINRPSNSSESTFKIAHFSEIIKIVTEICKEKYDTITQKIKENTAFSDQDLTTGFIISGYDANETNQFKIYRSLSPSFKFKPEPYILAAQWQISHFLLELFYYPEMDVEQLKRLASFMLIETGTVSPSVGGQLKIATITLKDGFQLLTEQEIQDIISENQPRFAKYRRILLDNLGS